jgi:hypothetical protein
VVYHPSLSKICNGPWSLTTLHGDVSAPPSLCPHATHTPTLPGHHKERREGGGERERHGWRQVGKEPQPSPHHPHTHPHNRRTEGEGRGWQRGVHGRGKRQTESQKSVGHRFQRSFYMISHPFLFAAITQTQGLGPKPEDLITKP